MRHVDWYSASQGATSSSCAKVAAPTSIERLKTDGMIDLHPSGTFFASLRRGLSISLE
jgi:hypothetical protein